MRGRRKELPGVATDVPRQAAAGAIRSGGARLVGIEGLRAFAACSILVFHSWLYSSPDGGRASVGLLSHLLPDLAFGVILFFTLSGFLLYRPFVAAAMRGERAPSVRRYLRNRALRILPAYWVILVVCALLLQSVLLRDADGNLFNGKMSDASLLVRSGLLVQHYDRHTLLVGIGPAWSLAVEVVFYLFLPALALLVFILSRRVNSRQGRRLVALVPAALMLCVGLTGKAAAAYLVPSTAASAGWDATWHSVIERSFWAQADLFAFGMALAVVRVDWEDGLFRMSRGRRLGLIAAGLLAYLATAHGTQANQLSYSPYNTLMAFSCATLLGLVVLYRPEAESPPMLVRFLELRPLVWVGVISYSVFLWHEPLVRFLAAHELTLAGAPGFVVNTLLLLAVTFALSTITYHFVERPALLLKRAKPGPRARADESLAASSVEAAP
jgi:peptidoglycan/LPS O-acetylase OafA/YrhL